MRRACFTLASALDAGRDPWSARPRQPSASGAAEDPLFAAITLIGAALDVPIRRPPEPDGRPERRDPVEAIASASRLRVRRVTLHDHWWLDDGGPLLGSTRAPGARPVALLPAPGGYVVADPATGGRTRVRQAESATLSRTAYSFYRPFAERTLRLLDLIRFGARGCERDLLRIVCFAAAAGLLSLIVPLGTALLFNDIIPQAARAQLVQLTLVLLIVAVCTAAFHLASGIALTRIEGKMGSSLQAAVWDRLLGLPVSFFHPYTAGDLATRAMGIDAIRQVISAAAVTALLSTVVSLFHFCLLFYFSARLAVWAALLIGIAVAGVVTAGWLQMKHQRAVAVLQGRIAGTVLQFLSGISKLRVAGAEVPAFDVWARGFGEQRRSQYKARAILNALAAFNAAFPLAATMVIYAAAVPLLDVNGSALRTGDFLAFTASFVTCLSGFLAASTAAVGTLVVVPLYEQAKPILVTTPEVDLAKREPGALRGAIELRNVSFRYREDGPPVLRDVSLRAAPGEFIALVGPSGSGKSTVLRLLLGFETPSAGSIHFDGQALAELDIQSVRRQIGVVLQSARLLSGDIFTNIVGSSTATAADAWDAARLAGLDRDIAAMPMGMHTLVGEGGGSLSGGQRQRLIIARALIHRPRILFFDEATSALDNRTQAIISESVGRMNATRIVVAHRLSTILPADRIYVLRAGEVAEQGGYDELMRSGGLFAELAQRQLA